MIPLHPRVIVYCDHLLYASETFILAQAGALRSYTAEYAGLRRVKGLDLPEAQTHLINRGDRGGRRRELLFKLCGVAPAFCRELRALNPALIHAHFGADGYRALPLSRKLKIPLIVSFHGSDATTTNIEHTRVPYGHRRYLANRHVLQRGAHRIIAVSDFIRKKLLLQGFRDEKIRVHYIGVDTNLFLPNDGQSEAMVLFVGRLVERKGLGYLISAMAEVQNQYPNVELVVIGDGPLRRDLEVQARESLRRYRFLGTQAPVAVREWMGRASIFAAPSVKVASGEEEGFGMVFAEAQAMGKPVVSFASGGIVEAVDHENTGFLAPERDWRTLAQYLARLVGDENLCRRFGLAGRERVLRLFDLDKQTRRLEEMYTEITNWPRSAAVGGIRELLFTEL
jgi:colanic acid/amylovoran biosynthesis glycosyltransferase